MYDKRTFLLYVEQDLSEVQFPSLTEYSLNCLSVFCFVSLFLFLAMPKFFNQIKIQIFALWITGRFQYNDQWLIHNSCR